MEARYYYFIDTEIEVKKVTTFTQGQPANNI